MNNPSRRAARVNTCIPGTLIDPSGQRFSVTVLDVSAHGVRLRSEDEFQPGERLQLAVGKEQEQTIEVIWVRGCEAGAVFLTGSSLAY